MYTKGVGLTSISSYFFFPSYQIVANETKEVVQKEEQEANKKAQETQSIADDAQRDLNEAIPALVCYLFCF